MPAPCWIVTFADAQGRELPIRVFGVDCSHEEIERLARRQIEHLRVEEPAFTPAEPLAVKTIEGFGQDIEIE